LLALLISGAFPGNSALARTSNGPKTTSSGIKTRPGHRRSRRVRHTSWKRHGQQNIDTGRAREIQTALIREKYMDGEPSGNWDQATKTALTRFQADHGWQTKVLPDSRALIELGLGPKHEGIVNPESIAAVPAYGSPATNGNGMASTAQRR
jgi:hypothetical protein